MLHNMDTRLTVTMKVSGVGCCMRRMPVALELEEGPLMSMAWDFSGKNGSTVPQATGVPE